MKIYEFNSGGFGSLIDSVSGTKGTFTAGSSRGFVKTDKGLAMEFDGSATKIKIGNTGIKNSTVFSISLSIYLPTEVNQQTIFSNYNLNGWVVGIADSSVLKNVIKFYLGGGYTLYSNTVLKTGIWYDILCTYDNGNAKIYINNVLDASVFAIISFPTIFLDNVIGGLYATSFSQQFKGSLSRASLYNHLLTTQERNNLYKEFLNRKPKSEIKFNPQRIIKPTDLSSERDTYFTGDEYIQVMEFTDDATTSSSLRLNDSGDFAVVDWTGNFDFQEISTSAETTSTVTPSTVKIFAKNGVLTYYRTTNNNFDFNIANLPTGLTYYYNSGSNTTFGDIASLPTGLTDYYNYGNNTTSGDIANLPAGLTHYINSGHNTTSGDIANLPTGLTYYYNYGNNQVDTYTAGRVWDNNISRVYHAPAAGYGLSSTEVDNLLIDLDASGMSSGTINISGNNAAPGASGEAAIDALRTKGVSVTVTGGY
jgi:hypothetical protein